MTFLENRLRLAGVYGRSLFQRGNLPPGSLLALDSVERSNRKILLELASVHGPVFKCLSDSRLCICIVGLPLGRRLLKERAACLRPITLDLTALFPEGFMRQMEGARHRHYRDFLNRGVNATHFEEMSVDLTHIASTGLDAYANKTDSDPSDYVASLGDIASGMLVRVFFGARPDTSLYTRLLAHYHHLGPHGLVWNIKEKQKAAFFSLRDDLRSELENPKSESHGGILQELSALGDVDEAMLGNLIYMEEMGRYDLRGLLRWISKYASENSEWIEQISTEIADTPANGKRSSADAFVLETLRMDQSERLLRTVKQDFVFEEFFIPKGALVRVCMWEAHKDSDVFADPFNFDPGRFATLAQPKDRFSPFGLDHHQCPFSAISTSLASLFLTALAQGFDATPFGDGAAVRGAYHWEPKPGFSIKLKRHGAKSSAS